MMDLDQIAREGKLSRRDFLKSAALLGGAVLLGGCKKIIIENPAGPNAEDPDIVLDTYVKDLTGKHGRSNWSILCSYDINYSNKTGTPVHKTNSDGFTRFVIPLEEGDISARFAMAIKETPEGIDWNDPRFPSYAKIWLHDTFLNKGSFRYVFASIKEPYMEWSLVEKD